MPGRPGCPIPASSWCRRRWPPATRVEVVPGPAAAIAALVVSGLPTGRWVFEGFLPRRGSGRAERLVELAAERRTIVLYEAPHRLARTVADLAEVLGPDRPVVVARELTKLHEEVWRGTLDQAVARGARRPPRGEYVLVVAGAAPLVEVDDQELAAAVAEAVAGGRSTRDAVALVAGRYGVARRRVYDLAAIAG